MHLTQAERIRIPTRKLQRQPETLAMNQLQTQEVAALYSEIRQWLEAEVTKDETHAAKAG